MTIEKLNEINNTIDEAVTQPKTISQRTKILLGANKCISQDRNAQYGEPEDNFQIIGKLWSDYLDFDISAHDVGIMMTLFKIGRIKSGGKKEDNYIDAAGYIACAGEIAERR